MPTHKLLHGPAAVQISAAGMKMPLYVQFVNPSGVQQRPVSTAVTRGLNLEYDDEFSQPLSATRTGMGAVYASGKPNFYGVDDFGDAIFSQPDHTSGTSSTVPGGFLRIPARALTTSQVDPAGYGRRASAGLLSSAHLGGSGFSAQYGYFEVRMLAPGGAGTWPAFWMLSVGSLGGGSQAEVDAVELYGSQTRTAFQAVHSWVGGRDVLGRSAAPLTADWALAWHTFGARVTPSGTDFYVDGTKTGHAPRVVHADQPFFFLVNLALTGEWNAGLAGTGHRVDLFIDSVRVWV